MFRTAVDCCPCTAIGGIGRETEFRGDDDLVTDGRECLAEQFFIGERAVNLGSIEKIDTQIDGFMNEIDHFTDVGGWTISHAHSHTSQTQCGHFQAAFSKFAFFHGFTPF